MAAAASTLVRDPRDGGNRPGAWPTLLRRMDEMSVPEMRTCKSCGEAKPLDAFRSSTYTTASGTRVSVRGTCKACTYAARDREAAAAAQRRYAEKNPDVMRTVAKRSYSKNREAILARKAATYAAGLTPEQKEKRAEANRRWQAENRALRRRATAAWRFRNPDQVDAWRKTNPEKARDKQERRRARAAAADTFAVTARDLRRIYQAPCWACGASGSTWDHRIPLARGGRHSIGNALPLCQRCNASKGTLLLSEWRYRDRLNR